MLVNIVIICTVKFIIAPGGKVQVDRIKNFSSNLFAFIIHLSVFCALIPCTTILSAPMQQQAFHPIYLGLGVHKANPISIAENEYKRGGIGSKLSYRFFLHDEWAVGLSGGFKTLTKDSDLKETFLTLSQETQRLFRIYHPFWLGLGTQIMYIAGVENSGFPIERDPTQPPQVGVGAGISLFYIMNSSLLIHGDVSRWRGTASNRLHVLEVGIGISIALN